MSKRLSVALFSLNTLLVIGAFAILATPTTATARTTESCDNMQCDGITKCEAAPNNQCFRNYSQTECLTRICGAVE